MMARQTHNDYAKFTLGYLKYYRAVIMDGFHKLRVLKRRFTRARDAVAYKQRFLDRVERLRGNNDRIASIKTN